MFVLNHGTQYAIYAPYIQRIINYKTEMEFGYDGKHGAYHPHIVWGPAVPPPPPVAAAVAGPSAATPTFPPARAPSACPSRLVLLPVEARSRMFLSGASRP
jgi:hypothetical protein